MLWGDPFDFAQRRLFAQPKQKLQDDASKEDRSLRLVNAFVAGLPTKKICSSSIAWLSKWMKFSPAKKNASIQLLSLLSK